MEAAEKSFDDRSAHVQASIFFFSYSRQPDGFWTQVAAHALYTDASIAVLEYLPRLVNAYFACLKTFLEAQHAGGILSKATRKAIDTDIAKSKASETGVEVYTRELPTFGVLMEVAGRIANENQKPTIAARYLFDSFSMLPAEYWERMAEHGYVSGANKRLMWQFRVLVKAYERLVEQEWMACEVEGDVNTAARLRVYMKAARASNRMVHVYVSLMFSGRALN